LTTALKNPPAQPRATVAKHPGEFEVIALFFKCGGAVEADYLGPTRDSGSNLRASPESQSCAKPGALAQPVLLGLATENLGGFAVNGLASCLVESFAELPRLPCEVPYSLSGLLPIKKQ